MSQVKTAISIDQAVFKAIDFLAKKAHISRSHLFEMAVREWVKKEKEKDLTAQINRAIGNHRMSREEAQQTELMRRHQRKFVEGEW